MKLAPVKADLHIHSCLSPCGGKDMTPPNLFYALKRFDLEIISVIDHNSCGNAWSFADGAQREGYVFVPGIEVQSAEEVHLLGYFPDVRSLERFCAAYVTPNLTPGKNDPAIFGEQILVDRDGRETGKEDGLLALPLCIGIGDLIKGIHDNGGLAAPAHLDKDFSLVSQLGFVPEDIQADAFEIYDLEKTEGILGKNPACKGRPLLSSSDAHHLHHLEKPKMSFFVKSPSVGEVFLAFKGLDDRRILLPGIPR